MSADKYFIRFDSKDHFVGSFSVVKRPTWYWPFNWTIERGLSRRMAINLLDSLEDER